MTIHASFATSRRRDPDWLLPLCREVLLLLATAKRSIDDEIHAYPTPIPRCDAQFNHLYEERARLGPLIERLRGAAEGDGASDALASALAAFVAAPPCTRGTGERDLRDRVGAALAGNDAATLASLHRSTPDHAADRR